MNAVTIDSTYLTNNGPAPYLLNTPNTVYTLTADVTVTDASFTGEVFLLDGDNIFLDLGSHFIQVNGMDCPQTCDSNYLPPARQGTARAKKTSRPNRYGGFYANGAGNSSLFPGPSKVTIAGGSDLS